VAVQRGRPDLERTCQESRNSLLAATDAIRTGLTEMPTRR
jgi:hypothetical protein